MATGVGVATGASRMFGLGRPDVLVFDELYYAIQAREIAYGGVERGHTVHPPLGKWLLAAGVRALGFDSIGWRIVPLLAGAMLAAITVVVAWRITESLMAAGVAGLLVATDGIAYTTGRLALLDGLLAVFATLAVGALLSSAARPLDDRVRRRATWTAAVALGAGLATKWSAAPLTVVALVVFCGLVTGIWPPGPERRRQLRRTVVTLLAVPAGIYLVSYVPTVLAFENSGVRREVCAGAETCDTSLPGRATAIVRDHRRILEFHRSLDPRNRFAASGLTWITQSHPTGLLLSTCDGSGDPVCGSVEDGSVRRIIAVGNPVIWLAGFGSAATVAVAGLRRRDVVDLTLAGCIAALWLPWVIGGRPGYAFYGVTLIPLLAIALARTAVRLPRRWRHLTLASAVVVAIAGFAVLVPVWSAWSTDPGYPFGWFTEL